MARATRGEWGIQAADEADDDAIITFISTILPPLRQQLDSIMNEYKVITNKLQILIN